MIVRFAETPHRKNNKKGHNPNILGEIAWIVALPSTGLNRIGYVSAISPVLLTQSKAKFLKLQNILTAIF